LDEFTNNAGSKLSKSSFSVFLGAVLNWSKYEGEERPRCILLLVLANICLAGRSAEQRRAAQGQRASALTTKTVDLRRLSLSFPKVESSVSSVPPCVADPGGVAAAKRH